MRSVYLTTQGSVVHRRGAVLHVRESGRSIAEVPVHDVRQVVVVGSVLLTPPAMDLLVERGVDTVFLSVHGKYKARLVHGISSNVRLRLAQIRRLDDPACVLDVARRIVDAKASNARTFLQRFGRRHGSTPLLEGAIRSIAAARVRLAIALTVDEVRGCEGSAAAAYFRAFGSLLRTGELRFDGRNRRPPMDPVNALLSLGYTFLFNAVEAAVHVVGLDPFVGALHSPMSSRPSLVCDLMEEFRVPLVDAVVVAAINRGVIGSDGFEELGPGEPVRVRRETIRDFARMFERRLDTCVDTDVGSRRLAVPYRQRIESQVRGFARFACGDDVAYEPHRVR